MDLDAPRADRRPLIAFLVGMLGLIGVALAWPADPTVAVDPVEVSPRPGAETHPVRWLAVGGGPTPHSNELSIEEDIVLASDVLGAGGQVLFAGGPGTRTVQVGPPAGALPTQDLLAELAFLFAPRRGRDATYRATRLEPLEAATAHAALQALIAASRGPGPPLLVLFAGHGDRGDAPADNVFALWANSGLTPVDVAAGLDAVPAARQVRLVVSTCHSGGFEEVLFRGGSTDGGVTDQDRCGLFSTTWDRQASGCSAAPDRRTHQGFNKIFFQALARRDEHGNALPLEVLDLDGDGTVSLLEAHARVRIRSDAIDVPTTTSERWLRELAPPALAGDTEVRLPIEEAVADALSRRLAVADHRALVRRMEPLQARLVALDRTLADAQAQETQWFDGTAGELLARWAVIDDPWHPHFRQMLATDADSIRAHLDTSDAYARFRAATVAVDQLDAEYAALERQEAPLLRLQRAWDTLELAGRVAARGGHGWSVFQRLRACEAGEVR